MVASMRLAGRDHLVAEIGALLDRGHHILVYGPAGVGKSALLEAVTPSGALVLDPFEHVTPHAAATIRLVMDRGRQCLAAARSLDRQLLGAVRRIAWRFTTVRVPPLSDRWMRHVVTDACARAHLPTDATAGPWTGSVVRQSHGRPGLALAIVREAAGIRAIRGALPSPATAAIEAHIRAYATRYPAR
jgi:hypothetical protein